MRFKKTQPGDERVRTFFAFTPQRCWTTGEIRWMETVTVSERYFDRNDLAIIGGGCWYIVKFLTP
jgi:hypothetical protein